MAWTDRNDRRGWSSCSARRCTVRRRLTFDSHRPQPTPIPKREPRVSPERPIGLSFASRCFRRHCNRLPDIDARRWIRSLSGSLEKSSIRYPGTFILRARERLEDWRFPKTTFDSSRAFEGNWKSQPIRNRYRVPQTRRACRRAIPGRASLFWPLRAEVRPARWRISGFPCRA